MVCKAVLKQVQCAFSEQLSLIFTVLAPFTLHPVKLLPVSTLAGYCNEQKPTLFTKDVYEHCFKQAQHEHGRHDNHINIVRSNHVIYLPPL